MLRLFAIGAIGLAATALGRSGPAAPAPSRACDFQASFMTWDYPPRPDPRGSRSRHQTPLGNKARIEIEALADVVDEASGKSERYVLIAPCRTEWVYAEKDLFQVPGSEYRLIFSLRESRGLGAGLTVRPEPSLAQPVADEYRSLRIDVRTFPRSRELRTPAEINVAVAANLPIVGRTEVRDPARGQRYVLEYPIRTMNFRPENGSFQTDTGPMLVPDLKSPATKPIERLEMGFVAYNHLHLDRADFILRRPTPIKDAAGREVALVAHYSEPRAYPAVSKLFAGERR